MQNWKAIGTVAHYTVWECTENEQTIFNVTEGKEPQQGTGGYGKLNSLLSMKGLSTYSFKSNTSK